MRKRHWLFVDTAKTFGGHEVMLLRWMEELHRQGCVTPVLIARIGTRLYECVPEGVLAMPLPAPVPDIGTPGENAKLRAHPLRRFINRIINIYLSVYRLARYVRRLRPEVAVVAEGTVLAEAWNTLLLRLLGVKTVIYVPLTQSGTEMGFSCGVLRDWLVRNLYRHLPQAWVTLSAEQAQHFSSWSRVARTIFVLPNTVTPEIEQAIKLRDHRIEHAANSDVERPALKQTSVPLRVLILGRLDAHQKGLDTLINYLCFHTEISEDFHFTFVGDGPFGPQIEQRLRIFPALQKFVSLHKWSATLEVMRQHDVLLLASRYEGVPLVMLEAMALGVPVIATNLPGTHALLEEGCLFSIGDYQQMTRLLHSIKQNERRRALIKRNREMFLATASGAAFACAVDALTEKLTNLVRPEYETNIQSDDVTVIRT